MQIVSYKVNKKHRTGKPTLNASMWTVSEWVEIQMFGEAGEKNWKSPDKDILWSLHRPINRLNKIGEDLFKDLFFAKYTCDHNKEWHGYPVQARGTDIPPECVLELWREIGHIDKTDKKRIKSGQYQ